MAMQYIQSEPVHSRRGIRLGFDAALLISVLFFPWWATVIFLVFGIVFFDNFAEAFLAGLFMDALFSTDTISLYGFRLFFSSGALVFFVTVETLKKKMRFWNN